MNETPNGPHDPVETDSSSSPQPGRLPYAGSEWRRPDAPATPPSVGAAPEPGPAPAAPDFSTVRPAAEAGGTDERASSASGGAGTGWTGANPGAAAAGGPGTAGSTAVGAGGPGGNAAGPANGGAFGWSAGTGAPPQGGWSGGTYGTAPIGPAQAPYGPPQYGATRQPPYGYGGGTPTSGAPWPYPGPEPKKPRAGKRLVTVGVLTAVLGGLAGGGLVAALDHDDTTASAGGITIQGSSAPAAQNKSGSVEAAAATAMKSVVTLSVRGSQEAGTGSGVVIRSDGYVLTNEHVTAVADGGGSITVAFADGRTASARLVGADKETDLAVVKVNLTGLTAATFADSDAIKVGQTVVAVGSPLGLNGTVTEGIVSALHRPTSGASDNSAVIDAIQTDAAINPGNSGGALVDLAGRVVGINQSIATAGSGGLGQGEAGNIGIGFAIPSDTAARISQQLISSGKATHALLGVQTQTATSDDQVTAIGATIATVAPGGAAADAGIKAGDVVTKVDDRVIVQSGDLAATIRSYAPGTKVTLTVKRGNDTRTVAVTLGSDANR
jgi:putative serine protease PepD